MHSSSESTPGGLRSEVSALTEDRAAAGEPVAPDGATDLVARPEDVADSRVDQVSAPTPGNLRADFGAHFEANYQRLVAQLYAITLDPAEAHDAVQEAYSRAWRDWARIRSSPDAAGWVRRVAIRSTIRSWRRLAARFGLGRAQRRSIEEAADPRTRALLSALRRLTPAERRAVVLTHMVGAPLEEIAALEGAPVDVVQSRLARARQVVTEGMADVLPEILGSSAGDGYLAAAEAGRPAGIEGEE